MRGFKAILAGATLALFAFAMQSEDPPPEHAKWMKDLGEQMGQLRKGVDLEKNATAMQETLKSVGAWWKPKNSSIASENCGTSFKGARAIVEAAKASDKAGIQAGMKMVGAGCKGCHDAHREKISDTVYKIKY
jgi:cytochrome c556